MAAALLESAQVPGGLQVKKWMYFIVCCWILITSGFMVMIWKGTRIESTRYSHSYVTGRNTDT